MILTPFTRRGHKVYVNPDRVVAVTTTPERAPNWTPGHPHSARPPTMIWFSLGNENTEDGIAVDQGLADVVELLELDPYAGS